MRVRIARSERMPTLYSYFVSNFSEDVLEHFKSRTLLAFIIETRKNMK